MLTVGSSQYSYVSTYQIPVLYRSVPGKRPLPGKHPCTAFQGVNVAASIQMYGRYIPGNAIHPALRREWSDSRD